MKVSGIIKKIDSEGKITIPKILLERLNIPNKMTMEFFYTEDSIILKKYEGKEYLQREVSSKLCLAFPNLNSKVVQSVVEVMTFNELTEFARALEESEVEE